MLSIQELAKSNSIVQLKTKMNKQRGGTKSDMQKCSTVNNTV